jgi:hypothetical protein
MESRSAISSISNAFSRSIPVGEIMLMKPLFQKNVLVLMSELARTNEYLFGLKQMMVSG